MENTITNRQIFFILFLTLTCYSAVPISKQMIEAAGTGAWLTLLITALIFAIAAAVIVHLNNMFPGQTLFDYAPSLITKPLTYLISIYYILYFFLILTFLVTEFSKLFHADFFPKSPVWSFPLLGIPLFCFIAYKGVTNAARLTEIVGIVFAVTAAAVHIIMVMNSKVNNILPIFNAEDMGRYISAFKYSIFPYLGIEILLIFPFTQKNGKKSIKTAFLSVMAVGLYYIMVVESCLMKLGPANILHYNDAIVAAIRNTAPKFLEVIARLDITFLTVGFGGLFVGIALIKTALVEFICRLFKNASRLKVVIVTGIVTYLAFLIIHGMEGLEDMAEPLFNLLGLISVILIPLILLIIAKAKKKKKKAKNNAS